MVNRGGTDGKTDGGTDGCLEIPPCVLKDIGPLGPLPKNIENLFKKDRMEADTLLTICHIVRIKEEQKEEQRSYKEIYRKE